MKYLSVVAALVLTLGVGLANAQKMVRSTPANKAKDVPLDIGELNFHFDQDMITDSWSFIKVKWAKFPPLEGKDDNPWVTPRHCRLKVGKLEPKTIYVVQLNSGSKMGFRGKVTRMPLSVTVVMFTTGEVPAGESEPEPGSGGKPEPGNPLGGEKPEPGNPLSGGNPPSEDASMGGGGQKPELANPLAGGKTPATGPKVMLREAAKPNLVVRRELQVSEWTQSTDVGGDTPGGKPEVEIEQKRVKMVVQDTYVKVKNGQPRLIRRKIESGSIEKLTPKAKKWSKADAACAGRTVDLEVSESGVVRVVDAKNLPDAARGEIEYMPLIHLLPGREVAVGEEWTEVPRFVGLFLGMLFDVESVKSRAKVVSVMRDPVLGCEVAHIEGEVHGTGESGKELTFKFEVDFAPALGIPIRQTVELAGRRVMTFGSGEDADRTELRMKVKFVETARVVSGGGKSPAKDTTIGGGGKTPEPDNPLSGGGKTPPKDNTIGGGSEKPAEKASPKIAGKWKGGGLVFDFRSGGCQVTPMVGPGYFVPIRDNRVDLEVYGKPYKFVIEPEQDHFILVDRKQKMLVQLERCTK